MRVLANILWHIPFLGFLSALLTFLVGSLLTLTVIAAPVGLGLVQHSKFLLTPFSSRMINKKDLNPNQNKLWLAYGFIVRIFYFPIGLALAVVNIIQIVGLCITIVGIPLAIVLAKSLGTFFNPVNKIAVPKILAEEVAKHKARKLIEKYSK